MTRKYHICGQTVAVVKILLLWELIIVLLCMLIIKIYILILAEDLTQKLDDTVITADAKYQINFARPDILLYNRSNSLHHLKCKRFQNKTISILFM